MLGLWMYSWDLVDWQPASPEPPVTPAEQPEARRSNEGGGHNKYQSLGDDYWLAREGQLAPIPIEQTPAIEESNGPLRETQLADAITRQLADQYDTLQKQLTATLQQVSIADPATKMQLAAAAMQLSLDISKLRKQYYERARSIRLLDVL
jgi:hypothetical protein